MKKIIKSIISFLLIAALILSLGLTSASAKSEKIKLSKKTVTMTVNSKKVVTLKNVRAKVKWKVTKGKKVVSIKKKGKYKNKVIISAKKTGSATLRATYKKKNYKVKIKVNKAKSNTVTATKESITTKRTEAIPQTTERKIQVPSPVKGLCVYNDAIIMWANNPDATLYHVYINDVRITDTTNTHYDMRWIFDVMPGTLTISVTAVNEAGESARTSISYNNVEETNTETTTKDSNIETSENPETGNNETPTVSEETSTVEETSTTEETTTMEETTPVWSPNTDVKINNKEISIAKQYDSSLIAEPSYNIQSERYEICAYIYNINDYNLLILNYTPLEVTFYNADENEIKTVSNSQYVEIPNGSRSAKVVVSSSETQIDNLAFVAYKLVKYSCNVLSEYAEPRVVNVENVQNSNGLNIKKGRIDNLEQYKYIAPIDGLLSTIIAYTEDGKTIDALAIEDGKIEIPDNTSYIEYTIYGVEENDIKPNVFMLEKADIYENTAFSGEVQTGSVPSTNAYIYNLQEFDYIYFKEKAPDVIAFYDSEGTSVKGISGEANKYIEIPEKAAYARNITYSTSKSTYDYILVKNANSVSANATFVETKSLKNKSAEYNESSKTVRLSFDYFYGRDTYNAYTVIETDKQMANIPIIYYPYGTTVSYTDVGIVDFIESNTFTIKESVAGDIVLKNIEAGCNISATKYDGEHYAYDSSEIDVSGIKSITFLNAPFEGNRIIMYTGNIPNYYSFENGKTITIPNGVTKFRIHSIDGKNISDENGEVVLNYITD